MGNLPEKQEEADKFIRAADHDRCEKIRQIEGYTSKACTNCKGKALAGQSLPGSLLNKNCDVWSSQETIYRSSFSDQGRPWLLACKMLTLPPRQGCCGSHLCSAAVTLTITHNDMHWYKQLFRAD